jgi:hypothetical protein
MAALQPAARRSERACGSSSQARARVLRRSRLVEPDEGRTDWLAVLAEEAEGLPLVGDRHAATHSGSTFAVSSRNARDVERHQSSGSCSKIARTRLGERDCGTPFSHGCAAPIPGNRLGGGGRGINSDDQVAPHARAQSTGNGGTRAPALACRDLREGRHLRPDADHQRRPSPQERWAVESKKLFLIVPLSRSLCGQDVLVQAQYVVRIVFAFERG